LEEKQNNRLTMEKIFESAIAVGIFVFFFIVVFWFWRTVWLAIRIGIWGEVINQDEKEKFLYDRFTNQISSTGNTVVVTSSTDPLPTNYNPTASSGVELERPVKIEISTPITLNQKWKVYKISVALVVNKILIYKASDKELELEMSKKTRRRIVR
jgi:hypothetical protein